MGNLPPDATQAQPGVPPDDSGGYCAGGPGAFHLLLCFSSDGVVHFHTAVDDPPALAARLTELVREFVQRPDAIHFAAGDFFVYGDARPPWIKASGLEMGR
jgi:hypothetical protein